MVAVDPNTQLPPEQHVSLVVITPQCCFITREVFGFAPLHVAPASAESSGSAHAGVVAAAAAAAAAARADAVSPSASSRTLGRTASFGTLSVAVPVAGASSSSSSALSSTTAGGDTADDAECVVCLTEPKQCIVLPCRHFCVCAQCLERLNACPVCRSTIRSSVRLSRRRADEADDDT